MSISEDRIKYGVEPFNGKNYSLWCRRVEAVFAAKDLDKYLRIEADDTKAAEVRESKKAYALLLTLLDDKVLVAMSSESSACQIWRKLKATYTKDGAVNQILARKKLATMKKRRDCGMQQHIDELLGIVNDLRLCGVDVKDMDIVVYLLMSLPPEFDVIKAAIENQPSENLNIDFVTQRLVDAEALMLDKNVPKGNPVSKNGSVTCDNTAFSASKKEIVCFLCKGKGHYAKACRKRLSCYNCGRTGHLKRDCRIKKTEPKVESAAVTFVVGELEQNLFLVDSGATSHMSSKRDWFSEFETFSGTVACASKGETLEIAGIGTVSGICQGREIKLTKVLYVPNLNGELISVKNIQAAGYTVTFKDNKAIVQKGDVSFVIAELNHKGQYVSDFSPVKATAYTVAVQDANLWHRRMGHSSNKVLQEMGLPTSDEFCKECVMSKQTNEPMGKGPRQREDKPMRMVHTDICGPIDPSTNSGEKYFMTIVDDYSRFVEVHLLKYKSDIVEVLNSFFRQNPEVYKVRCDNAKEYVTGELLHCCKKAGILIDPAPPYTPALNGVAERANRYLLEKARALIFESKLSKEFWGYAVQSAAYLKNRMPSQSIKNDVPYKLKYGRPPDIENIKVFGCDAYMRISDNQRKKLDPKSKLMLFVGYSSMGYRLLDPTTKRVVISRNVKFDEKKRVCITDTLNNDELNVEKDSFMQNEPNTSLEDKTDGSTETNEPRPKRDIKLPCKLKDYYVYEAFATSLTPVTYEDLEKLPLENQASWRKAMDDEMDSLNKNGVWELVDLPENEKLISCKWVLREKRDGVYKARLVARGFEQVQGIDYTETYAPVISTSSLRLILVIIFQKELKVFALDVKTAFLNGELHETIFMEQPKGYDDKSGRVCKLLKSLYGLKQAPRQWFKRFIDFVLKLNFQQHDSEQCIFVKRTSSNEIIMVLYVDDLLIAGSNESEINIVIKLLMCEFEMSKAEVANEFLGICFDFSPDRLGLSQEKYIERILERFKMSDCKPSDTPLIPKTTTSDFEHGESFHGPFRELIGTLLYLATTTRPDILYSVNCLSQIQEQPTEVAWSGLKRVLRYLRGTSKLKLMFHKSNIDYPSISVYVDADWGADARDRKSISGYIIMLNDCPITWCVKKQTSIAISSTEAEILAFGKAVQDVILLYNIVKDILSCTDIKVTIFEDNQSAIKTILNENYSGRLKHLDIKLKYIRETINSYNIKLEYVSSENQLGDMFTKSLPKPRLFELRSKCGVMCD